MFPLNLHSVGNQHMMALLIVVICLRERAISPLRQAIEVELKGTFCPTTSKSGNVATRSASVEAKLERTLMIAYEKQQGEQPDASMLLEKNCSSHLLGMWTLAKISCLRTLVGKRKHSFGYRVSAGLHTMGCTRHSSVWEPHFTTRF